MCHRYGALVPTRHQPEPAAVDPRSFGALTPLGVLGGDEAELTDLLTTAPAGRPARVVRMDRDRVAINDGHRIERTDPEHSLVDDPDTGERNLPVVGDWVVVSDDDPPAVLALGHRRGRLLRRDPGELPRPQLLASGVDVVLITVPLDRPPNVARLERELVTAFDADAEAVVVFTKGDLRPDVASFADELRPALRDLPVVVTSASPTRGDDVGVASLRAVLRPNRTGVLLGPSGAGKSTLTNAIVGRDVRAVGEVRQGDSKGRHTTATRALVTVPGGGILIDSPGLRALGLWDAESGLDRAFPEITAAAENCRFDDCTHRREPGCEVRQRITSGVIRRDRLERYTILLDELVTAEGERTVAERRRRRRADRRR